MNSLWHKFVSIDYKLHLVISVVLRLCLIIYSIYHDLLSDVPYTDIDYKVFTDASRYVLSGRSPYNRYTYRYSPLVAIFLVPNITLHHSFGKILFSLGDIIVAVLIRLIIRNTLIEYEFLIRHEPKTKDDQNLGTKTISLRHRRQYKQSYKKVESNPPLSKSIKNNHLDTIMNTGIFLWLYNPLIITVSTRGNCDSLAVLLVLLTLYTLQCRHLYFISGLIHGVSVHFRLYPVIYSLSFFMFLSNFSFYRVKHTNEMRSNFKAVENDSNVKWIKNVENAVDDPQRDKISSRNCKDKRTIFKKEYLLYIIPNLNQIKFIMGCTLSFSVITYTFYTLYGYTFLYETYIYHLVRKDTRHNFSLYFYLQYLTAWVKNIGIWQKVLIVLPQIVLLLVFSVRYGLNKFSLNFSVLTQTIVMVIYNTVLTSQYFVWIMAILPLCLWQIKISKNMTILLLIIWFAAQGAWLLPAYLLEFKGQNTFLFIWIQGVSFFCVNIAILGRLIMYFVPPKSKTI